MADNVMLIGESFIGDGADAAHVNTVLGSRNGPVGIAWATALATPRPGNAAFVAVVRPGVPAKPLTLFVSKASVASDEHATLTWGAAQAGVACGVADAVADGIVTEAEADELVLIAAVWVNPAATDAAKVYANNRAATAAALRAGTAGDPSVAEMLAARDHPVNPFFDPAIAASPGPAASAEPGAPAASPTSPAPPAPPAQ
jgi:5,6,7,8-tetrahydromethanopterin hydro-lyase